MEPITNKSNIRTTTDADHIVTVWIDVQGKSVNTFTAVVLDELRDVIGEIEKSRPAGVIFASAKPGRFIAGADLFEIKKFAREQVLKFLADGQEIFTRISRLSCPTAAAIAGDCLGGGLELALACTYRVAAGEGGISIGLPEVKLGILPAWGGTTRLPRLIGLTHALPLLIAGKTLPRKKALKAGIVDEVVRPEALLAACKRLLLAHVPHKHVSLADRVAAATPFVRHRILTTAREQTHAKTFGHYPAPLKLIEVVSAGLEHGFDAGLAAERQGLADLMETDAARNLMRLFFLRQGAKRSLQLKATPAEVKHAVVIGGGTMGAGIAHAMIRAGVKVRLVEVDANAVSAAMRRVQGLLKEDVGSGRISELQARRALHLLSPTTQWTGLHLADIAIEAVVEKMDAKREVFSKLDRLCRPDTVLATNTSSLPVGEMAQAALHHERVVGLHFFNPVPKMPLVEVVRTTMSDDKSLATAAAFALKIGKTPVLVNDSPGFLVNRVLIPYLSEAIAMAAEGVSIPAIDSAMKQWGMPMGPFELLDEIGLDVAAHVLKSLSGSLGDRASAPPGIDRAIERGWLGKKAGRGFYLHKTKPGNHRKIQEENLELNDEIAAMLRNPENSMGNGNGTRASNGDDAGHFDSADEAVQWRLLLPMVNEAARLLEEGVTNSTDAIDLATVLGTGLAPFRGGLAAFADSVGLENIVRQLGELAARHGPRFAPAPLLRELAATHKPLTQFAAITAEKPLVTAAPHETPV